MMDAKVVSLFWNVIWGEEICLYTSSWFDQTQEWTLIFSLMDWTKFHFNPFTPMNDHYLNSPYKFNTLSRRQEMRIKKIVN